MNKVQVLMSTYNGELYVAEQINSILSQREVETSILVRDDGSKDKTKDILNEYKKSGVIDFYAGANLGYAKSFLHVLASAPNSKYYAFSDQDDVWCNGKLIKATKMLDDIDEETPACYFSNLKVVDSNLKYNKIKSFEGIKLNLGSIIVRQRVSGCTMVFNKRLVDIIRSKDLLNLDLKYGHDNWLMLVCLSVGGKIIYDREANILFRRHSRNVSGLGGGIKKRIFNETKIFRENKNSKEMLAKQLLEKHRDNITSDNLVILERIVNYRRSYINTLKLLFNKELQCGIMSADILMKVAVLFRCF
jgi:glycosyltransferase involved in cell wall biosynthesis